ncbi:MAG: divergent PAP2 family protein [Erysipelotrichaceae bacterium]|nr:divergent PAP2 family protein [Erysipelotrichaceae bacterium]
MNELLNNKYVLVPFVLWIVVQVFKVIFEGLRNKKVELKRIFGSGGMPSAHSAVVCSLATLIGKYEGLDSSTFAIAAILAIIVMYDACGVRYQAGKHAVLLNDLLNHEVKLEEMIGHTYLQVAMGAILGIIVGLIF